MKQKATPMQREEVSLKNIVKYLMSTDALFVNIGILVTEASLNHGDC